MDTRFFTVQEANELIPFLSTALHDLRGLHGKLELWAGCQPPAQEILFHGGMPVHPQYLSVLGDYRCLLQEILAEGCHLKDLESGLVDFPTIWEGREVYLCWKLGESEVCFWHEIEAGYAGRQSLKVNGSR